MRDHRLKAGASGLVDSDFGHGIELFSYFKALRTLLFWG